MASDLLHAYRQIWQRKPVLRVIYDDFYDRILATAAPGLTIEIGAGVGALKERDPGIIAVDIQGAPWLDCVADAQRLPFADASVENIVMIDVLHHVEFPALFFREAARVLAPGGRVIMIEPAITWGSTLFYRLMHHEPVRMRADPLRHGTPDPRRDPYGANQAVPTLIATRDRRRFEQKFADLRISRVDWFSFMAYPLSGGFKRWSLLTEGMARRTLAIERAVERPLGHWAAFRMMLVVEKGRPSAPDMCYVS
jgi:SAM-dependent methyltransferase